ncbi:hypothetical protein BB560_002470 [Smittium megazygosporum]|uniref:Uncharacterized protein n=1 Tax=Smittium megazygosporum TaxID=133381 RepID=A0A2T9ZES4_9FUNG|nr:hypothetical protein BB560_002470 [Smittium megazygosporum]
MKLTRFDFGFFNSSTNEILKLHSNLKKTLTNPELEEKIQLYFELLIEFDSLLKRNPSFDSAANFIRLVTSCTLEFKDLEPNFLNKPILLFCLKLASSIHNFYFKFTKNKACEFPSVLSDQELLPLKFVISNYSNSEFAVLKKTIPNSSSEQNKKRSFSKLDSWFSNYEADENFINLGLINAFELVLLQDTSKITNFEELFVSICEFCCLQSNQALSALAQSFLPKVFSLFPNDINFNNLFSLFKESVRIGSLPFETKNSFARYIGFVSCARAGTLSISQYIGFIDYYCDICDSLRSKDWILDEINSHSLEETKGIQKTPDTNNTLFPSFYKQKIADTINSKKPQNFLDDSNTGSTETDIKASYSDKYSPFQDLDDWIQFWPLITSSNQDHTRAIFLHSMARFISHTNSENLNIPSSQFGLALTLLFSSEVQELRTGSM